MPRLVGCWGLTSHASQREPAEMKVNPEVDTTGAEDRPRGRGDGAFVVQEMACIGDVHACGVFSQTPHGAEESYSPSTAFLQPIDACLSTPRASPGSGAA